MNFYVWWIISILVCMGMRASLAFKMIRDVVNEGYKFKIKNLSKIIEQIYPDGKKINNIKLLIPGFNILDILMTTYKYNQANKNLIDGLRVLDVIEPMTDQEIKEYQENPTTKTALDICMSITNNITDNVDEIDLSDVTDKSIDEIDSSITKKEKMYKELEKQLNLLKEQRNIILKDNNDSEITNEDEESKINKLKK